MYGGKFAAGCLLAAALGAACSAEVELDLSLIHI